METALEQAAEATQEPAIAVDNGQDVESDVRTCPTCGTAFRAKGRNRLRIIHCSTHCRNRAWAKVNRPPVAKRRRRARSTSPDPTRARPELVAAMTRGLLALGAVATDRSRQSSVLRSGEFPKVGGRTP
jgi:hypothetical protein